MAYSFVTLQQVLARLFFFFLDWGFGISDFIDIVERKLSLFDQREWVVQALFPHSVCNLFAKKLSYIPVIRVLRVFEGFFLGLREPNF